MPRKLQQRILLLSKNLSMLLMCLSFQALASRPDVYWGGFGSFKESSPNAICERWAEFKSYKFVKVYDASGAYHGEAVVRGCEHTNPNFPGSEVTIGSAILEGSEFCEAGSTSNGAECQTICTDDQTFDEATNACISPVVENSCATTSANPIDFIQGKKYRKEPVLTIGNRFPIALHYHYNSHSGLEKTTTGARPGPATLGTRVAKRSSFLNAKSIFHDDFQDGQNYNQHGKFLFGKEFLKPRGHLSRYWRHNYEDSLVILPNKTLWHRASGNTVTFDSNGQSSAYPELSLQVIGNQWEISHVNKQKRYTFDEQGRLILITDKSTDHSHTLSYAENGIDLERIQHSLGYFIEFEYESRDIDPQNVAAVVDVRQNYPIKVIDSDGLSVDLEWNQAVAGSQRQYHLITRISHPYTTAAAGHRAFEYNNGTYHAAITEIYDQENSDPASRHLYAEFRYDAAGRAIYSGLADGVDAISVDYSQADSRTVTNALNKSATYHFSTVDGVTRLTNITGEPTASCLQSTTTIDHDSKGHVSQRTVNGQTTSYQYNARGLESLRIEALGTPEERSITTQWHPQFNLPTRVDYPAWTQHKVYDNDRNLMESRQAADGESRSTRYTYTLNRQVESIDGPRNDLSDTTAFTYDNSQNIIEISNALGQTTVFGDYDNDGQPGLVTDLNGVQTQLAYNARGWLISSTLRHPSGNSDLNLVTQYDYNGFGQIVGITLPDGQTTQYEYDNARRLIAVQNALGQRYELSLDNAGNTLQERIHNASQELTYQLSRTFDELSRVTQITGAANQTTHFNYDADGNIITSVDGKNNTTTQEYDALHRLKTAIAPLTRETRFTFNPNDQIASVTDARGLTTTYTYNGFGDLTQLNSPDTGIKDFAYDAAGNLISEADARGVIATYQYDALNRLTHIDYPSAPEENVRYEYDSRVNGNYGIGRLTKITDASGEIHFHYNYLGKLAQKNYSIGANGFSMRYAYDVFGRLIRTTYPSGRFVNYSYNALGQIDAITTQASANDSAQTVVSDVHYLPFGPIANWLFGNGVLHSTAYDLDYRIHESTAQGAGPLRHISYAYDANNNITTLSDILHSERSQALGYNAANEITSASGLFGDLDFVYDAVGNRVEKTHTQNQSTLTENYHYAADSQQLLDVSDSANNTRALSYDASGNLMADSDKNWAYNARNRPSEVTAHGTITHYEHNSLGQRTLKQGALDTHYYHYDEAGQLVAVSDSTGTYIEEHIWLYSTLVGTLVDKQAAGSHPEILLSSPQANAVYAFGDAISLDASASDATGDLTATIEWVSDIDGLLGTGGSLANLQPSPGSHVISARVSNALGLTAVASRLVHIVPNASLTIYEPVSVETYVVEGSEHRFSATAIHHHSGDMSSSIQWASDINGIIGTGSTITPILSTGQHNITASFTDSNNVTVGSTLSYFVANGTDTDADGLPDNWEVTYFQNLDTEGQADSDGDGQTNLQEYQAGTDPTLAPSILAANHSDLLAMYTMANRDGDQLLDETQTYPGIIKAGIQFSGGETTAASTEGLSGAGITIAELPDRLDEVDYFAFSFWVRSSAPPASSQAIMASHTSGSKNGITFISRPNGAIAAQIKDSAATIVTLTSSATIADNHWRHVVLNVSQVPGGQAELYVDGVLETSATITRSWTFAHSQWRLLGRIDRYWKLFSGELDEVRMFSRHLTNDDIADLQNELH